MKYFIVSCIVLFCITEIFGERENVRCYDCLLDNCYNTTTIIECPSTDIACKTVTYYMTDELGNEVDRIVVRGCDSNEIEPPPPAGLEIWAVTRSYCIFQDLCNNEGLEQPNSDSGIIPRGKTALKSSKSEEWQAFIKSKSGNQKRLVN